MKNLGVFWYTRIYKNISVNKGLLFRLKSDIIKRIYLYQYFLIIRISISLTFMSQIPETIKNMEGGWEEKNDFDKRKYVFKHAKRD